MNLKENEEEYIGGFGVGKGREESNGVIIISKVKQRLTHISDDFKLSK